MLLASVGKGGGGSLHQVNRYPKLQLISPGLIHRCKGFYEGF